MSVNKTAVSVCVNERKAVRLHLTNIVGLGAVRLLQSLLASFASHPHCALEKVYLPAGGELANLMLFEDNTTITLYKRYLPNTISRLFECTFFGGKFNGLTPLLVFGDIPLRCKTRQTVFVQTQLLIPGADSGRQLGALKYWVARWLFRHNIRYVSNFIVQTKLMKLSLVESYPEIKERIHVIALPPPHWLIESQLKRTGFNASPGVGLRLFYPAAFYPHKNHRILSEISQTDSWPVSELILTISKKLNPNPSISWMRCVEKLESDAVMNAYENADALLFLSLSESYGFPLVEAMWIGLPIICPDLPYARTLCGEQAIYFDPHSVNSLRAAIEELNKRRNLGWWPDWSANLKGIPHDWQAVTDIMLHLATSERVPS
jgi:glycosyltransferase involved in cell wall biosynthesis